jgi:hypothetical protein
MAIKKKAAANDIEIVSTPVRALLTGLQSNKLYTAVPAAVLMLLQAGAALVTIVNGFKKTDYDEKFSRELQAIHETLQAILEELRTLRPWFIDIVDSAFRKDLEGLVYATKKDFESELTFLSRKELANPSGPTRRKFEAIAAQQRSHAFRLQTYGPLAYVGIGAATFSAISIWAFARSKKEGVVAFIGEIVKWLNDAIDPNKPGSFGAAHNIVKAEADAKRGYVEGAERNIWLGYYVTYSLVVGRDPDRPGPGDRERDPTYVNWYGDRTGDFNSGIGYNPTAHRASGQNPFNHRLSRIEGAAELHDRDQSGRARAENLARHFNDVRGPALELYRRLDDIQGHIETIKKMIAVLEEIARKYK